MSGADRLEDGFPHGTVDGYLQGCKGGDCPMGEFGLSCRRAKQLAAGDYRYPKLTRRGATPVEIALELGLAPELHAAPVKRKAAVPYEEEDVPVADLDDGIGGEESIMESNTQEAAPSPATIKKNPKPEPSAEVPPWPEEEVPSAPVVKAERPDPTSDDEKRRRAEIRMWAAEHGIKVGDRGRLPHTVVVGWLNDDPTLGGTRKPAATKKPRKPSAKKPRPKVEATPEPAVESAQAPEGVLDRPEVRIEHAVIHGDVVPDMETRAVLFNDGFAEAEKQSEVEVAVAEAERDAALGTLGFVLEQWGRERRRADTATSRALAAEADLHAERITTISDLVLIESLDRRVRELTEENERLSRPWWRRWAS